MESLGDEARRFHAARLRSRRLDELEERASFTRSDAARLFECRACGLLARWPRPSPDWNVRRYAEDRYSDDRLAEMIASSRALHRRQLPVLRRLVTTPSPRIVEVGSFVGGFLEVARTAGLHAVGADPNPQLVESCRARGLHVVEGTLAAYARSEVGADTDVVAIWNTFDQLADPRPELEIAAWLLRPGGLLAVRVPNGVAFRVLHGMRDRARRAARRFFEACLAWNNLLSFPYLHGYGMASLDRLVPRYGFERAMVRGDVLGPLVGAASSSYARSEETAVKRLQRAWIALQARDSASPLPAAPWLDVYYRRVGMPEIVARGLL
jgi:SAM-dependent methyltransferase